MTVAERNFYRYQNIVSITDDCLLSVPYWTDVD